MQHRPSLPESEAHLTFTSYCHLLGPLCPCLLAFLPVIKHVTICLGERRGDQNISSTSWKCKQDNVHSGEAEHVKAKPGSREGVSCISQVLAKDFLIQVAAANCPSRDSLSSEASHAEQPLHHEGTAAGPELWGSEADGRNDSPELPSNGHIPEG